ncbi:hypothetical protein F4804DRAFT_161907 [Jackrogersella minutella]|nr:hypothetical protein F4804DRAFT_161907 [Jackrogersella minutella]
MTISANYIRTGPLIAVTVPSTRIYQKPVRELLTPTSSAESGWRNYFGTGDLEDWRRLMVDLGLSGTFTSKTQCRKALQHVWVNIVDFLEDVKEGRQPYRFENEKALRKYTRKTKRFYPKSLMPKGSPLRSLFAKIVYTKC